MVALDANTSAHHTTAETLPWLCLTAEDEWANVLAMADRNSGTFRFEALLYTGLLTWAIVTMHLTLLRVPASDAPPAATA